MKKIIAETKNPACVIQLRFRSDPENMAKLKNGNE